MNASVIKAACILGPAEAYVRRKREFVLIQVQQVTGSEVCPGVWTVNIWDPRERPRMLVAGEAGALWAVVGRRGCGTRGYDEARGIDYVRGASGGTGVQQMCEA